MAEKTPTPSRGAMRAAHRIIGPNVTNGVLHVARIIDEEAGLKKLVQTALACVHEWDENEIGQIDGDFIEELRAALSALGDKP